MFAADTGSVDPRYPVNTQSGSFLKSHGATVLGTYGYSISPSSSRAAEQTAQSFQHVGGKVGVLDTTVPFGAWTSPLPRWWRTGSRQRLRARHGLELELRPGHGAQAGRGQAQGCFSPPATSPISSTRQPGARCRATTSFALPALVAAQCRHRADAGGHGEVRPLHQDNSRPSASTRRGPAPTS